MRAEDARSFMRRDRAAVAAAKDAAWLDVRRTDGIAGVLHIADELREQALLLHPQWPSTEERADDLSTHARVAEAMRRVGRDRRG
jgi:hypothetical protein